MFHLISITNEWKSFSICLFSCSLIRVVAMNINQSVNTIPNHHQNRQLSEFDELKYVAIVVWSFHSALCLYLSLSLFSRTDIGWCVRSFVLKTMAFLIIFRLKQMRLTIGSEIGRLIISLANDVFIHVVVVLFLRQKDDHPYMCLQ